MKLNEMRLDIGCGENLTEGHAGIDFRPLPNLLLRCDIFHHNLPFKDRSVDSIVVRHVFEHVSYLECENVLREWFRILKPSATIDIIVPNILHISMKIVLNELIRRDVSPYVRLLYGGQRFDGDTHYGGFTPHSLSEMLSKQGFVNVKVSPMKRGQLGLFNSLLLSQMGLELHVSAKKGDRD